MEKNEFEQLIGRNCSLSEFMKAKIVQHYMDLDWQDFCVLWKQEPQCFNFGEIQKRLANQEAIIKIYCAKVEQILARLTSILESIPVYHYTDDAICKTLDLSTDLERYIAELKEENHDTSRI